MRVDSMFSQARAMVAGNYSYAIDELGFRPEQAFAYTQDELERLMRKDAPGANAVLQTAIYMEGIRRGLRLSRESQYAIDMLEILADTYEKCSVESLVEIGVDDKELEIIQSDMDTVRKVFL
jgi:hypothetical protein